MKTTTETNKSKPKTLFSHESPTAASAAAKLANTVHGRRSAEMPGVFLEDDCSFHLSNLTIPLISSEKDHRVSHSFEISCCELSTECGSGEEEILFRWDYQVNQMQLGLRQLGLVFEATKRSRRFEGLTSIVGWLNTDTGLIRLDDLIFCCDREKLEAAKFVGDDESILLSCSWLQDRTKEVRARHANEVGVLWDDDKTAGAQNTYIIPVTVELDFEVFELKKGW